MDAVIDIHTHILPNVDDGAASMEIAIAMCRMAAADGTRHLVATPHANDEYPFDRKHYQESLDSLQAKVDLEIQLSLGCDFHFSLENVQSALQEPERFVIGGSKYLLIEFSDFALSPYVTNGIAQLRQSGLKPIVTHPERNLILQGKREAILRFIDAGCLIQVTADSFCGSWGPIAQKTAEWLLQKRAIHAVASDAHDTENRPPRLSPARTRVVRLAGEPAADLLFDVNPGLIVSGHDVSP